jgi:hypothetical protein
VPLRAGVWVLMKTIRSAIVVPAFFRGGLNGFRATLVTRDRNVANAK